MTFTLTIVRRVENPNFEKDLEAYNTATKERDDYRRNYPYQQGPEIMVSTPKVYLEEIALNVILSEEQFEIIKANVMKEWR